VTDHEGAVERTYKEHSARILAVLVRVFGTENLELAEDVLQGAFQKALHAWQEQGVPENPAAWILAAAKRQAIDVIRGQRTARKFASDLSDHLESGWTLTHTVEQEFSEPRIWDHQLRMLFMCTNADIADENRLPLILRTLCGFSVPAISRALFLSEATVKKRLVRTRERLAGHAFEFPAKERLPDMMDSVHTALYLLFNEGFHSSEEGAPMKLELCREAIHLTSQLVAEPRVVNRDTLGLLALMQFHLARSNSRLDERGNSVPLDLQDRKSWSESAIEDARQVLRVADVVAPGATQRFYFEAKIAEQHCIAGAFSATDWHAIVAWYDALVEATHSPVAELNRAVALGYAGDVDAAIALTTRVREHAALRGSHLPCAVLAHLSALQGDAENARRLARHANQLGGTSHEQRTLLLQIERLLREAGASFERLVQ
jgi:RNA polymerase sigma-70 factor (ECF subfamily)